MKQLPGDEISHFEFGASDIVLVFQKDADIHILGAQDAVAQRKSDEQAKVPCGYATWIFYQTPVEQEW